MVTRDGDLPAYIGADGTQEWWKDAKWYKTINIKVGALENDINVKRGKVKLQ